MEGSRVWQIAVRRGALVALASALALASAALARDAALGDWRRADELSARSEATAIDERAWAARLVEALGIADVLPEDHDAEDVYGLLCPERLERRVGRDGRRVAARAPLHVRVEKPRWRDGDARLRFVVQVPKTALYVLAVSGRGGTRWSVDRKELGGVDPTALGIDVADSLVPLAQGAHELEAHTAPGARIDAVELSAFRPLCIAPAGGWGGAGPLRFGTKARTLVQAFGLEGLLPALGDPIEREGEDFDAADSSVLRTNRELEDPSSENSWAVARSAGEMLWRVDLERPGLFSLVARVHGGAPQLWSVDDRYTVRVTPESSAGGFAWTDVLTLPIDSGEHVIRARMAAGSGIDSFQLVRRSTRDEDYLALMEGLGFTEGAAGAPVSPAAAEGNLTNPGFATLTAHFLEQVGGSPGDGVGLLADELDDLFMRPLSPVLPAEVAP